MTVEPDDPYIDVPLWNTDEDDMLGLCRECGEVVQHPDDTYCAQCLP